MVEERSQRRGGAAGIQMAEEEREERRTGVTDFGELAKFYRDSYLEGLKVALKGQEEMENLIREGIIRGFAIPKESLKLSRQWVQGWSEDAGGNLGLPNPWLVWSKECAETACGIADLYLKATEDLFTSWFSLYDKVVAQPARKYTWQFNKECIDGMFQG